MSKAKYTLMNKNQPVLDFEYDLDDHIVTKIADVHDLRYAPPAIVGYRGEVTKRSVNEWWRGRAIPASRDQISRVLDDLDLNSTLALAEANFGLSLSDRYWINDPAEPQRWEDINFFDNDFAEDLGLITLGQNSSGNPNLMSPNSTLNGDLKKKWTIVGGERLLVKAGSGFVNQEVYNEVVATRLYERLLDRDDYVPFSLHREGRETFCACPNMLCEDEELIPAWDLIANRKKPSSMNDYQFVVSTFEELGLHDVEERFAKMFTCDFILANSDRHYRNFGVIRNVETLEYTRIAPIYDTGTCLWCRSEHLVLPIDYQYVAKPFGADGMKPDRQLALLHDYRWFDPTKLSGFAEEAISILDQNENMPPKRLDQIRHGLERNVEDAVRYAEHELSKGVYVRKSPERGAGMEDVAESRDASANLGSPGTPTHADPVL